MIKDPQIFIVFEPGMMGTFFCNLFLFQETLINDHVRNLKWTGDRYSEYNAHKTLYKDTIETFHSPMDLEMIKDKDMTSFFAPLENKGISIHRLASWEFLSLDYPKYFSNYVIGLVAPSEDNVSHWVTRSLETTNNEEVRSEWWYKNVKNFQKIPKAFIDGMRIKERKKYLEAHYEIMKNSKTPNRMVRFDLDPVEIGPIQKFCDQCCEAIGVKCFDLPTDIVNDYLEKNKILFDKTSK